MLWYNDLAARVQEHIGAQEWAALLGDRHVTMSSRAKTIDTLRQKLIRSPATPLQNVQDIAGVRFEARMTLSEQDAVAAAVAGFYGHPTEAIHDIRLNSHSGYRAVHVWLRVPAGRVEVQIRTALQSEWANLYESAADVIGRDIRYGAMPDDDMAARVVRALQGLSLGRIADFEKSEEAFLRTELGIEERMRESARSERWPEFSSMRDRIQELRSENQRHHDALVEGLRELRTEIDSVRDVRGGEQ
jgi:ppGpp synthetase/RelA/SpoT-type nucleotidyltranferase